MNANFTYINLKKLTFDLLKINLIYSTARFALTNVKLNSKIEDRSFSNSYVRNGIQTFETSFTSPQR